MDTGDTGKDTGESEHSEIVSAAKLAGETGGISCSYFSNKQLLPLWLSLILVILILKRKQ